jgi:hypothetical protein
MKGIHATFSSVGRQKNRQQSRYHANSKEMPRWLNYRRDPRNG